MVDRFPQEQEIRAELADQKRRSFKQQTHAHVRGMPGVIGRYEDG